MQERSAHLLKANGAIIFPACHTHINFNPQLSFSALNYIECKKGKWQNIQYFTENGLPSHESPEACRRNISGCNSGKTTWWWPGEQTTRYREIFPHKRWGWEGRGESKARQGEGEGKRRVKIRKTGTRGASPVLPVKAGAIPDSVTDLRKGFLYSPSPTLLLEEAFHKMSKYCNSGNI